MRKLSRRKSLELGAAAIIVGPSVIVSRSVHAAAATTGGLKANQYTIKVGPGYGEITDVVAVDLGGLKIASSGKIEYTALKLTLDAASKDAAKISLALAPETTQQKADLSKISVSLLAGDGKTPAVTYHASKIELSYNKVNKLGEQVLAYKIGSIDVDVHKISVSGHKLPADTLKMELDGVKAPTQSINKVTGDFSVTGESSVVGDFSIAASTFVTVNDKHLATSLRNRQKELLTLSASDATVVKTIKVESSATKTTTTYSKASLSSIEYPKLSRKSDALVTETLTFVVDKAGL